MQRTLPVAARLQRVDRLGRQHLAGGIDHRDLAAGADAGVQPHHDAGAGGRGQQQVPQVLGEHLDRDLLGGFAQTTEQITFEAQAQLDLPAPGDALADQVVGRPLRVAPTQVHRDAALGQRDRRRGLARGGRRHRSRRVIEHQLRVQQFERAAAKHRQRAVRRHGADRLGVVEVVAEFRRVRVVGVLAVEQLALEQALGPQPLAQLADQHRILGPALGQDVAHPVEHGRRVGETTVGVDEGGGLGWGIERRVGEQPVRQRLQAGFAGDHRLGAALLLERQVQVFQFLLGRRRLDGSLQFGGQLALLADALEHRLPALFELAQIGQPRFEFAQLDVIEVVGGLLAVARDERHRCPAVEQFDSSVDLGRTNLQFGSDLQQDLVHVWGPVEGA